MKRCPECGRDYNDDSMSFCLDDGSELLFGPASGSSIGDEPQTAILHSTAAPYPAKGPRYANDGSRFACFLADEKSGEWTRLAIIPFGGGAPTSVIEVPITTSSSRGPVWTPDDKGITLIIAPGEQQNLLLQPVDGGPAKAMTNFETNGVARRDYSRDGKRIAIVRAEGIGNAIMITDFR